MKPITLAVFFLLGGTLCTVRSDAENENSFWEDFLEKKCKKAGIIDPLTGFYETLMSTMECLDVHNVTSKVYTASQEINPDEFCKVFNKNVRECFQVVVTNTKKCLEPEEQYLPNLIFKAIDNLFALVCDAGDNFADSLDDPSFAKCKGEMANTKFIDVCWDKHPVLKSIFSKNMVVIKRNDLCSDLQDLHNCYEDVIKSTCTDPKIAVTLLHKLRKAIFTACIDADEDKNAST